MPSPELPSPTVQDRRARTALVICTANVCRSPTVERLLQRRLDGMVDLEGHPWIVTSAGTSNVRAAMDPNTISATTAIGVDLRAHRARHVDADTLTVDGADLVVAMTREHLRAIIGIDPAAWPRTFTLKELVRRAAAIPRPSAEEGVAGWLQRVAQGRRAADLLGDSAADDIEDPYGRPRRSHDRMVAEVSELVDRLVQVGPWRPAAT